MIRAALLLHTAPDGAAHLDLLIERRAGDDPDARALIAFRLPVSALGVVLAGRGGPIDAELLPDHRRLYLGYEGPIAGGRGEVRRVASGRVASLVESAGEVGFEVDWGGGAARWRARGVGARWVISAAPLAEPPAISR